MPVGGEPSSEPNQHSVARRCAVAAPVAALVALAAAPALADNYPPPGQPTTSTSATEAQAGQPVTLCAENYAASSPVQLTDNQRPVTTVTTNSDGKGCATVEWSSPDAKAHPTNDSAAPAVRVLPRRSDATTIRFAAFASPPGTVCHTMAFTGPDSSGAATTTSTQVCIEPANSTGSQTSGGEVSSTGGHSVQSSGLPFTGAQIAAMVAAALALLALGFAAMAAGRRRRASS